ncbi:amidohydrolase family protein [Pseudonocardia sp. ICBG1293]|uniref:amidohydrolase family protein n=1 Tax=Pseudonocardia sp. ICBG1293 TaxID=2844382 RepID=UPI001CC9B326|nr:amidohydrolase family protein [Pseudonocardia sp. ICBG1293]
MDREQDTGGSGADEAPVQAPVEAGRQDRPSSRRSLLKRAGTGVLLVGAGAIGVRIADSVLRPATPRRAGFPAAGPVRIDDVTVVDPLDGSRAAGMSIVVRDGRIESVSPTGTIPVDQGVRVVAGAGRFAVPGFNNMHTHALQAERPELALATMLAEGVTGMRQMEGSAELLRYRAEQRLPLTPRAPGLLAMPGDLLLPFNARSVEGVREEVARQWDQGADFIKMIMTEREVFFAAVAAAHEHGLRIAGHLPPSVTIDEASRAGFDCVEHLGTGTNLWISCSRDADALRKEKDTGLPAPSWVAGLPFAGDVFTRMRKGALTGNASVTSEADVRLFARALDTFDPDRARDLAAVLVENGTWQCPTLVQLRGRYLADDAVYRTDPWLETMSAEDRGRFLATVDEFAALPAATRETFRRNYERTVETVGIWHRAGVPVLAGTDGAGRAQGNSLQLEFRELAKAGLSPLEVLRSATTSPARHLGRTGRMGRIAGGMDADLVLLDADPLAAVDNLASISLVVRGGHPFTADELADGIDDLAGQGRDRSALDIPAMPLGGCCS